MDSYKWPSISIQVDGYPWMVDIHPSIPSSVYITVITIVYIGLLAVNLHLMNYFAIENNFK
jgi:hypothetical protein